MKKYLSILTSFIIILTSLFLVLLNNYYAIDNAPSSITYTPFLIGIITGMILFLSRMKSFYKFGIITSLVILNDLLIRLYSCGTHDNEGNGWVMGMLFIGLVISLVFIVIYYFVKKRQNEIRKSYWINFMIYLVILIVYINLFYTFGMKFKNDYSESFIEAKNENRIISILNISVDNLVINKDTIVIKNAWVEKQTQINHLGLFPKIENTGIYYYLVEFETIPNKYKRSGDYIYYSSKQDIYDSAYPIDNYLVFRTNNLEDTINICIFKDQKIIEFFYLTNE